MAREVKNYSASAQVHRPQSGQDVLLGERSNGVEWVSEILIPNQSGDTFAESEFRQLQMVWNGQRWTTDGQSIVANVSEDESGGERHHLHAIGLRASFSKQSPRELLAELEKPDVEFSVETTGETVTVTASTGEAGYRWVLDKQVPARVHSSQQRNADGTVLLEARCSYRDGANENIPQRIQFMRMGAVVEDVVLHELIVDSTPPPKIDPTQLGVEVGTNIIVSDRSGKTRIMGWDGYELRTYGEIVNRIRAGDLKKGPRFQSNLALASSKSELGIRPDGAHALSEWERYVSRFIENCILDSEQAQRAWQIYSIAKERADRVLERIKPDLQAAKDEVTKVHGDIRSGISGATQAKLRDSLQKQAELVKPIQEIFDRDIKRRLPRLLHQGQSSDCMDKY